MSLLEDIARLATEFVEEEAPRATTLNARADKVVHLYRGENALSRGGLFFSDNINYAKNFVSGPQAKLLHVSVPAQVAQEAASAAISSGDVGYRLPEHYVDQASQVKMKTRRRAKANQDVLTNLTFQRRR